ncbi:MAG: TIGR03862 family flavoprotein [Burkholderiaceae bacterium]|nr:TIGR03862 family flavoprotein [Burkholderiaceae bacterium]
MSSGSPDSLVAHSFVPDVAIVGGGPAGLIAAEVCAGAGLQVAVFDAMPSVGRKFLLAGKGGLNLTHSEPLAAFETRFGSRADVVRTWLASLGPDQLRGWAEGLGIDTFVGSYGRVFPEHMKAAPLLRAWVSRLRQQGVRFHTRHRWLGMLPGDNAGAQVGLVFDGPQGHSEVRAGAVVLACGGGSWARLGSDGAWVAPLRQAGVEVADLMPANCGFDVEWSAHFIERHAGEPLKNIQVSVGASGMPVAGEAMLSARGIEGGAVYAVSSALRDAWQANGHALLTIDLLPAFDLARVTAAVSKPRGAKSWSSHLQANLGLKGAKASILRECAPASAWNDPMQLAASIKRLPVKLVRPRPIDEAISTAGGVCLESLDDTLQCRSLPNVACAGEMLDWEAPTGGYLLTAVMASAVVAAYGVVARHDERH